MVGAATALALASAYSSDDDDNNPLAIFWSLSFSTSMTTMMECLSNSPPHAVVVEPPCDFPPHRVRRRLPQFVELPNLHIFVVGVVMFAIIVDDVVDSVVGRHLLGVAQDDAPGQFQIPCGLRLVGVHRGHIGDAVVAPVL